MGSIVWCLAWHPVGHILTTGSNDHTVKFWSRNRPGDSMRDKYNLNTLPPGHEEEYGNLGDAAIEGLVGTKSVEQPSSVTIPGMGPEDKVQSGMTIPGLDFQGPPDLETGRKKQPFPGSALFHAIQGGENAVRDVLARDFGIGGQQQGGHQQGQGGHQGPPPGGFQGGGGGGGNFGGGPQGGGGNNYGGPGMGGGPNSFGGMQGGGRDERNFGGNRGDFGGIRRGHWERGGRNRM